MSANAVFLITGANRGIGLSLAGKLLARPNVTVVATVRSTSTSTAELEKLPIATGNKLIITTLSSTSDVGATEMIQDVSKRDITHIDTIIANAGSGHDFQPSLKTPIEELRFTFEVNALGPIKLFQAAFPLLQKSASARFILISSSLGSIGAMEGDAPTLAYGVSKAAANYFVRKVHYEHEDITAVAVHPGWIKTEMGQGFADAMGIPEPNGDFEDCVTGVLAQIDAASRTTTSGSFVSFDGTAIPW